MSNKIIGNTTATPNPQPNWAQTDETKADYIKNKPSLEKGEGLNSIQMPEGTAMGEQSMSLGFATLAGVTTKSIASTDLTFTMTKDETNVEDGKYFYYLKFNEISPHWIVPFRLGCQGYAENNWIVVKGPYDAENGVLLQSYLSEENVANCVIDGKDSVLYYVDELVATDIKGSYAEGANSVSAGAGTHAEGIDTFALGDRSHAEGSRTRAFGFGSHTEGIYTTTGPDALFAHAEGGLTEALGQRAHAEGSETKANGFGSHSEGGKTVASTNFAHSEGQSTQANGRASHSEGYLSRANADYAHAEGNNTVASKTGAHSEGINTTASHTGAHSEGHGTNASGWSSHSEGIKTNATADATHAEGSGTIASHQYSHAEGQGTKTSKISQHVEGKYNADESTAYHITGCGTSDTDRKNCFTAGYDPAQDQSYIKIGNVQLFEQDLAELITFIRTQI